MAGIGRRRKRASRRCRGDNPLHARVAGSRAAAVRTCAIAGSDLIDSWLEMRIGQLKLRTIGGPVQ